MKYTVLVDRESAEVEVVEHDDGSLVIEYDGQTYRADLQQAGDSPLHSLVLNGESHEVFVHPDDGGWTIGIGNEMFGVRARSGRLTAAEREAAPEAGGELVIAAPMTGVVVSLRCEPGRDVERGDVLLVLEAMKMNNEIRAPRAGVVKSVHVSAGQRVDQRARLVVIE